MSQKRVAIFDVDGTIFRSSLTIRIVEELIADNVFPPDTAAHYARQRQEWIDREGDYESYINALVASFRKHLKGVSYNDFLASAKRMAGERFKETYRYTRDLIPKLKKQGYYLLAISHSPKTVLDQFCPHLGFDKAYGVVYETGPQNRFTGAVVDEHLIANKANIVKRAVEKEGLTLEDSVGVGDTESDIPFLELVSQAICFNPNMKLYKHAKREGWKVVVERKDVIYEL